MREIKFRIWDEEVKEIIDVVELDLVNGWAYYIDNKCERQRVNVLHSKNLMEFTGLKDKKGVEIYEGDIVQLKHPNRGLDKLGKVIFRNAEFYVKSDNGDESMYPTLSLIEVIGNIYKNPELLWTEGEKQLNKQLMKNRHNNSHTIMTTQKGNKKMREIKFRAWNKKEKMFVYYTTEDLLLEFLDANSKLSGLYIINLFEKEQQFTGFKDKNNKEIYEGDIIEKDGIKSEVIFLETDACYWLKKIDKDLAELDIRFDEVIGNIYENPSFNSGSDKNG